MVITYPLDRGRRKSVMPMGPCIVLFRTPLGTQAPIPSSRSAARVFPDNRWGRRAEERGLSERKKCRQAVCLPQSRASLNMTPPPCKAFSPDLPRILNNSSTSLLDFLSCNAVGWVEAMFLRNSGAVGLIRYPSEVFLRNSYAIKNARQKRIRGWFLRLQKPRRSERW